jgi:hypothetical protein
VRISFIKALQSGADIGPLQTQDSIKGADFDALGGRHDVDARLCAVLQSEAITPQCRVQGGKAVRRFPRCLNGDSGVDVRYTAPLQPLPRLRRYRGARWGRRRRRVERISDIMPATASKRLCQSLIMPPGRQGQPAIKL